MATRLINNLGEGGPSSCVISVQATTDTTHMLHSVVYACVSARV